MDSSINMGLMTDVLSQMVSRKPRYMFYILAWIYETKLQKLYHENLEIFYSFWLEFTKIVSQIYFLTI